MIDLCPDPRLLDSLRDCNKLLELVQKGLSDYLETKRGSFPRYAVTIDCVSALTNMTVYLKSVLQMNSIVVD